MTGANRNSATRPDRRKGVQKVAQRIAQLARLYLEDETAWLELTSRLVKQRRFGEIDAKHLAEFLNDMAARDRREVLSRLTVLLTHLLKWEYQPTERSGGCRATIIAQGHDLSDLLESKTLREHAAKVLEKAYERAVAHAAIETAIAEEIFPSACPYTLDQLLVSEPKEGD